MKITLLGRYGEGDIEAGPEKVARNLYEQIAKLNPDTEFITYFFKVTKKRQLKQLLFGSETVSSNQNIHRLGILKLIIVLIKNRPDLVHIVTFERFELLVLFLKSILRFKLVYTIHGIYRHERKIFYKKPSIFSDLKDLLLEKLLLSYSDSLIFLSPQMIQLAENYYYFDRHMTSIIPNGVSVPEFSIEKSFDISKSIEIVFYNGLDSSRKRGLEDLIMILSELRMDIFHLSVFGSAINTEYARVNFFNPLPEPSLFKFLNDKHIFIDNFNYMPFSILALETLALGLILIVSDESGISSYIKNGENGFVYDSKRPNEIRKILLDIAGGKHSLEIISKNAIITAKDLSWDKIAKQYFTNYQEMFK